MDGKVSIRRLKSGIPGLDTLLGGGLPEFSFNLIAGSPGCGKTTFAQQIMFALASPDNRALFFTVLGEPPMKMLRYQQQFTFFDLNKLNNSIRFINLSADLLDGNFARVLARISEEVQDFSPSLVFVDSFRSVVLSAKSQESGASALQGFVQQLGVQMTNWQATTFLIGEYLAPETESNALFTVADGIIWLSQNLYRNSMVRKMQVVKMRGQSLIPGLHPFRINNQGIHLFPRMLTAKETQATTTNPAEERLSSGIAGLDEMLGGGLPVGYSLLLVGPAGSGKTILATKFLAEGARRGECGVIMAFEGNSNKLHNEELNALVKNGKVGVINTRALDLSIDEIMQELIEMINRMQAKRVVIDSLSGFELALAPEFSEDFRGSLYLMIARLAAMGVTVIMTSALEDRYTDVRFTPFGSAFLADIIITQRYVEIGSQFKRALSVIKVRGSQHSKLIRLYDITADGIVIGEPLPAVGWGRTKVSGTTDESLE